ncbi:hypothetical protein PROFUN_10437 [Planoprotostelium fungivorum]|uniref:F-box domain-containing protein n=1 Tax=Planoprotostelium fungivorum TaxID=1890364 RepID=A0A2P6NDX6_9EUKA|nr:hypothetical protein PROFUN_10437 [Planoprotostelium fungivorum]
MISFGNEWVTEIEGDNDQFDCPPLLRRRDRTKIIERDPSLEEIRRQLQFSPERPPSKYFRLSNVPRKSEVNVPVCTETVSPISIAKENTKDDTQMRKCFTTPNIQNRVTSNSLDTSTEIEPPGSPPYCTQEKTSTKRGYNVSWVDLSIHNSHQYHIKEAIKKRRTEMDQEQAEMRVTNAVEQLNYDVFFIIISFMDAQQVLSCVPLVCRMWLDITKSKKLWQILYSRRWNHFEVLIPPRAKYVASILQVVSGSPMHEPPRYQELPYEIALESGHPPVTARRLTFSSPSPIRNRTPAQVESDLKKHYQESSEDSNGQRKKELTVSREWILWNSTSDDNAPRNSSAQNTCVTCKQNFIERRSLCSSCVKDSVGEQLSIIQAKLEKLHRMREKNDTLRSQVQAKIEKEKSAVTRREEINSSKARTNRCQERFLSLQMQTEDIKATTELIQTNNRNRSHALDVAERLVKDRNKVRVPCEQKIRQLMHNRKYLVAELVSFFPLKNYTEEQCYVLNVRLKDNYTQWKDLPPEIVATGISHILQILASLSGYVNVPLPYKTEFLGSRSYIWREGSQRKYLLYHSEPEFHIALEMLNWNVVHLCGSQGVHISSNDHDSTVPNLIRAIQSPNLGSDQPPDQASPPPARSDEYHSSFSLSSSFGGFHGERKTHRQRSSTHALKAPKPETERPRSTSFTAFSLPSSIDTTLEAIAPSHDPSHPSTSTTTPIPTASTPPKSTLITNPSTPTTHSEASASPSTVGYGSIFNWLSASSYSLASSVLSTTEQSTSPNKTDEREEGGKEKSVDEDFVVIEEGLPPTLDDDEGIAHFERAIYIDKVVLPRPSKRSHIPPE